VARLPANRPDSLDEQLGAANYPDLEDSKVKVAERFEDDLGADAAHALLAAGSKREQELVAYALDRLTPLNLHAVDCEPGNQKKPRKALLFGQIDPALPVVAALQANNYHQPNEKGPPRTTDLLLCTLYLSPSLGLRPIYPCVIEFDVHSRHNNKNEIVSARAKDRKEAKHGIETKHVLREDYHPEDMETKTDEHVEVFCRRSFWHVKERLDEVGEFARSRGVAPPSLDEDYPPPRKRADELPIINQLPNLSSYKFRERARDYCEYSYLRAASSTGTSGFEADAAFRLTEDTTTLEKVLPKTDALKSSLGES
jgi:hypothetical protein